MKNKNKEDFCTPLFYFLLAWVTCSIDERERETPCVCVINLLKQQTSLLLQTKIIPLSFFPKNEMVTQQKRKKEKKNGMYIMQIKEYSKNGKHTSSGRKIQEKMVGERDRVPCGGERGEGIAEKS